MVGISPNIFLEFSTSDLGAPSNIFLKFSARRPTASVSDWILTIILLDIF